MNLFVFYVCIVTNPKKTVLDTDMTNDLVRRLQEHYESRGQAEKFAGKFYCHRLVYWEHHSTTGTFETRLTGRRKSKVGGEKRN